MNEYTLKSIFKLVLKYKKELITANILALLVAIVSLPIPLLIPMLVDEVLLDKPSHIVEFLNQFVPISWHIPLYYLTVISLFTIVLRVSSVLIGILEIKRFAIIAKDITYQIRKDLLKLLSKVAMKEYEMLGSSTVNSRFVVDIDTIDKFLGITISKFIISVLIFISVSIVLLVIHWQLALFLLLCNPIILYFSNQVAKNVRILKKEENRAYEIFSQSLSQTLNAMQQVRVSHQSHSFFGRLEYLADAIRQNSSTFFWKNEANSRFSFTIFLASFDIFRAISMFMVIASDLSIGEMFAVFSYLWYMMGPIQELLNIQYSWHSANAAIARINEFMKLKTEVNYTPSIDPFTKQTTTSISMKNITFSYGKHKILDNTTLDIKTGETIAIMGESGSGKSTIINILLGLYTQSSGDIYFNNINAKEIGYDTIRANVATVLQTPFIFNATIKENLIFDQDISDEKIYKALEIAQIKDKVNAMPDGIHTIVGQNGVKLSGGQKQRLALARVILSDPKIVILDEATSSLDIFTEQKLQKSLNKYLQNITTIIIAHRQSSVEQADRIFVLKNGKLEAI